MLRAALEWCRSTFLSLPFIVLGTAAATLLGLLVLGATQRPEAVEGIKRFWARWVLACCFARLTVERRGEIPAGRAVLFCANHLSYLDPPALVLAAGRPVRFLAKDSLFRVPLFGWAMRREGDIPIPRANPRAAARSLARATAAARAGTSLVVFPEGSRSPDGTLQPFASGAFRLAIQAQIPVVPVAIRGSREILRPGSLWIHRGSIRIVIGEPLAIAGRSRQDQRHLQGSVETEIRNMLSEG